MPIVVSESGPLVPSGALEGFVLDSLDLNTLAFPGLMLSELKHTPAKKRPEWAENADADGALLIRDPLFENCQWDATVEVRAASRDAAHAAVGQITDKLEEADRNTLGIPLVWTPADSTKALTFYVLTGEINEIPITWESGYFATPPVLAVSLTLTCRPFGYGAEETIASVAGAGPLQIFSLAGVKGDVAAEGRQIVTDTATQPRDFAAWGLEYRYQNGSDLLLTQNELTNTGFAGTSTTRAGSVSTNIYRGTLTTNSIVVCGTGNQPHVGTYRVYARYWASSLGVRLRFIHRAGTGPFSALLFEAPPVEDAWCETDLGVVTIDPKVLGTQRWTGHIEAYSDTAADTIDIDYLILVPAGEGFGRARRPPELASSAGRYGPLSPATTANETWAGGGVAWTNTANVVSSNDSRAAVTLAFAQSSQWLKVTNFGFAIPTEATVTGVEVIVEHQSNDTTVKEYLQLVKGGTVGSTEFNSGSAVLPPTDALLDYGNSGERWGVALTPADVNATTFGVAYRVGHSSAVASGTVQIDHIRMFVYYTYAPFEAVINSGQSIEFRWDETQREDSTGTYWGPPPEYRGAPFFIPPAGDENRTSRVAVMVRRADIYVNAAANVTDNQSVEVKYTPRYLNLPR